MRFNYYVTSDAKTSPANFIASRVGPDDCPTNWEFLVHENILFDPALDALEQVILNCPPPSEVRMHDVSGSIEYIRTRMQNVLISNNYAAASDNFAVDAYVCQPYTGWNAANATYLRVSRSEANAVVNTAHTQRAAAPYYLRPGQSMENVHALKFGAEPDDQGLFFSLDTPEKAALRYIASVVHPDYGI